MKKLILLLQFIPFVSIGQSQIVNGAAYNVYKKCSRWLSELEFLRLKTISKTEKFDYKKTHFSYTKPL